MDLQEISDKRDRLVASARSILDKAEHEERDLSTAEKQEWEKLARESERLSKRLKVELRQTVQERHVEDGRKPVGIAPRLDPEDDPLFPERRVTPDDGEARALDLSEKLSDRVQVDPEQRGLSFGACLRGVVTGNWQGHEREQRAMAVGTSNLGGYTVPTPLALDVLDMVRNSTRVIQAGARTIPMDSATLSLAKVVGDPTPAWKAENAASTASDMTFGQLVLTARTLVARTAMSVELAEDSPTAEDMLKRGLAEQLALELDRVALIGSGTPPEPEGLYNNSSVSQTELGTGNGLAPDFDDVSSAVEAIAGNNHEASSLIYSPRTWGVFDRLKDTATQPLKPSPSFEKIRKHVTKQVPENYTVGTSTDCSLVFVGDFRNLFIGVRTDLRIEVSRDAADSSSSAFENLQVWVRAYMRADIGVARPEAFHVLTGVRG